MSAVERHTSPRLRAVDRALCWFVLITATGVAFFFLLCLVTSS